MIPLDVREFRSKGAAYWHLCEPGSATTLCGRSGSSSLVEPAPIRVDRLSQVDPRCASRARRLLK